MEQLRSREQLAGEDVDTYAGSLTDLYQKVDPLNQYPEEDRVQQFLKGLKPAIRMLTELNTPNNWNEAWQQAKKVENALKRGTGATPFNQPANVSQIEQAMVVQMARIGETMQVLATEVRENKETCTKCNKKGHAAKDCYTKNPNSTNVTTCYNCGNTGHWSRSCPEPKKLTCAHCGKNGHTKKECFQIVGVIKCYNCDRKGHTSKECTRPRNSNNNRQNNNWNDQRTESSKPAQNKPRNGRQDKQNTYVSQEQTINTLASTVGELVKKVQNLKD